MADLKVAKALWKLAHHLRQPVSFWCASWMNAWGCATLIAEHLSDSRQGLNTSSSACADLSAGQSGLRVGSRATKTVNDSGATCRRTSTFRLIGSQPMLHWLTSGAARDVDAALVRDRVAVTREETSSSGGMAVNREMLAQAGMNDARRPDRAQTWILGESSGAWGTGRERVVTGCTLNPSASQPAVSDSNDARRRAWRARAWRSRSRSAYDALEQRDVDGCHPHALDTRAWSWTFRGHAVSSADERAESATPLVRVQEFPRIRRRAGRRRRSRIVCQGRSYHRGELFQPRRLHRDQHGPPESLGRAVLQQARHGGAIGSRIGKQATCTGRGLSCHRFRANEVKVLQLSVLAYKRLEQRSGADSSCAPRVTRWSRHESPGSWLV